MRPRAGGLRDRYAGLLRRIAPRARAAEARDYSQVVDADLLRKLDRLSLAIGHDLITGLMGEHLARRRTSGIEFSDFREYSAGDDLGRIDWKVYARLGSLHVRQAQAEHDTVLYLLVDASPSMDYGMPPKFWAARRLAAGLGYIALSYLDNVIVAAPGLQATGRGAERPAPIRGRAEVDHLFRYLQEIKPGRAAAFDDVLAGWSVGRGLGRIAVIVSDLLLDNYRDGVRALVAAGFAVTVLHVLSPEEMDPSGGGELELLDSETGERLEVHLGRASLAEYRRRLDAWRSETENWCRSQGARYFLARTDTDVERVLLDTLRRGGVTA